jgi:dTDP-4-dehydrorhamnose reductase
MRRAWLAGKTLKLFTDEFRSAIPAQLTAAATWELLHLRRPGIYHIAGKERLSRWQLGLMMAARWPELNPGIEPASCKDYPGETRAPDTSLNCDKAQQSLSFLLPGFSDWLAANPQNEF